MLSSVKKKYFSILQHQLYINVTMRLEILWNSLILWLRNETGGVNTNSPSTKKIFNILQCFGKHTQVVRISKQYMSLKNSKFGNWKISTTLGVTVKDNLSYLSPLSYHICYWENTFNKYSKYESIPAPTPLIRLIHRPVFTSIACPEKNFHLDYITLEGEDGEMLQCLNFYFYFILYIEMRMWSYWIFLLEFL